MTSKEALNDIKQWVEYITRLDYVEPEVRNEVKKLLYDAYHKTTPEFKIIEQDLEVLKIIKKRHLDITDISDTTDDYELYRAYCIGKGYADEYICNEEEFNKVIEWLERDK